MTDKPLASALVWFRRDLRCDDHAALYHALIAARRVWCAFVFDRDILDPLLALGRHADRRVEYIHDSVAALDADLRALARRAGSPGGGLIVRHGHAQDELPRLAQALNVQAVYANHDDDPAALARDARVRGALAEVGIVELGVVADVSDHRACHRLAAVVRSVAPMTGMGAVGGLLRCGLDDRVAGGLDLGDQVVPRDALGGGHASGLGGVVHGGLDARHLVEAPLDARGAGGAGHAGDLEVLDAADLGLEVLGGRGGVDAAHGWLPWSMAMVVVVVADGAEDAGASLPPMGPTAWPTP